LNDKEIWSGFLHVEVQPIGCQSASKEKKYEKRQERLMEQTMIIVKEMNETAELF
jgi:hypothetical protein